MKGIQGWTEGWYVGKKSEYKTKEDFIVGLQEEENLTCAIEDVFGTYARYYPKGNSEFYEGESGEGCYLAGVQNKPGSFEVWVTENTWDYDDSI